MKTNIRHSETQLTNSFFVAIIFLLFSNILKEIVCFLKTFFAELIGITIDPDPDLNWAKILDPDQNSMYSDPQYCLENDLANDPPRPHRPDNMIEPQVQLVEGESLLGPCGHLA